MKPFASVFLAAAVWGSTIAPSLAETSTDKPRLAVAITGGQPVFLDALKKRLAAGHRFELVDGKRLQALIASGRLPMGRKLTLSAAHRLMEAGGADMLLMGAYRETGGVHVSTRLYDLRTGDFSRDLTLIGEAGGATATLAEQLANYIRHAVPIHCLVKDLREDQVVLDLGAMDGVTAGSSYQIFRHPSNLKPIAIGTLRVTEVKDFAAVGEVEDSLKGFKVAPGDALVEETSSLLIDGK